MRDSLVTTALDVLGLLLVAGGVGGGLYPRIGWWCLVAAGVLVTAGSVVTAKRATSTHDDDGDDVP